MMGVLQALFTRRYGVLRNVLAKSLATPVSPAAWRVFSGIPSAPDFQNVISSNATKGLVVSTNEPPTTLNTESLNAPSFSGIPDTELKPKKRRGGLHKECHIHEPLASFLGRDRASRIEVIQQVWKYIKEKELIERQTIYPDFKLKQVLQEDQLPMLKLSGALNRYIKKVD